VVTLDSLLPQYDLGSTLGQGGFAKVKLARHRASNEKVAIKIINMDRLSPLDRKRVKTEIEAFKLVSKHPRFARLFQVPPPPPSKGGEEKKREKRKERNVKGKEKGAEGEREGKDGSHGSEKC
jgi:serine/threonine protein kinase